MVRLFTAVLLMSFLLVVNSGCTRNALPKESVRLVIPFNGSSSSFATGDLLKHAVVNIQVPGRPVPIVQEYDFENNPIPWGSPIDLVVNNVPSGPGLLVQFMGVFETTLGASYLITYGDAIVDVGVGTTSVVINAAAAGSANKEGRVAGRYFDSASTGPTGTLIAYFKPPNGRPAMSVSKANIVAGWFDVFALDNIPLDYVVLESGVTVFGGLTLGSPALASAPNVVHMKSQSYYKRDQKNGQIDTRLRVGSDLILGYFKNANGPSLSPYKVCFASGHQEGTNGRYSSYNGATGILSDSQIYDGSGAVTTGIFWGAGGVGVGVADWSVQGTCTLSLGMLSFFHNRSNQGEEGFSGLKPPFHVINPFKIHGGYVEKEYVAGSSAISLTWGYLPGAQPGGAIDGVDVLVKFDPNGGGGGGGDREQCFDLLSNGYSVVGNTTGSSYVLSSFGAVTVSMNNHWNFQFALCPFKNSANGKMYVGNIARSECSGSCGMLEHYGWGTASGAITTGGNIEYQLGINTGRATAYVGTSPLYTAISVSNGTPAFTVSDIASEVLLTVIGEGTDTDCGYYQGQNISPGMTASARVLSVTSAPIVMKISKGTFLDSINPALLAAPPSGTNYCWVQVTKVPHFKKLDVLQTVYTQQFQYIDSTPSGIIAMRVSGEMSIAAGVTIAALSGFQGGFTQEFGAGHRQTNATGYTSGNSGGGGVSLSGDGGGGGSLVSSGGNGASGIAPYGAGGQSVMGGGGGGSLSLAFGGGGGDNGGRGGGMIFIAARLLSVGSSTSRILANGFESSGSSGAGGGGSVALLVQKQVGPSLQINVEGGRAYGSGGVGAGGFFARFMCTIDTAPTVYVNKGAGISNANANDGQTYDPLLSGGGWNPACY